MKRYFDYVKKIERERKKLVDLNEYENREMWRKRFDACTTKEERRAVLDEHTQAEIERDKIRANNTHIKLRLRIMDNNALKILFDDFIPIYLEYIKPLSTRSYGEKTAEKLNNYFKTNFNIAVYVSTEKISVIPLKNGFSFGKALEIYAPYKSGEKVKFITNENKLNTDLTPDCFKTYDCKDFIEDINGHIKKLKKAYEKAKELSEQYYNAVSDFNRLAVNINCLEYTRIFNNPLDI